MTTAEIQIEVRVGLDKASSLQYPDLSDVLVDVFLNRSQDIITEKLASGKAFSELTELITKTSLALAIEPTGLYGSGAYYCTENTPTSPMYLYHVSSEVLLTRSNFPLITVKKPINTRPIEFQDFVNYRVDLYNKPIFQSPKIFLIGVVFYLLADGYTVIDTASRLNLQYIHTPQRIVSSTTTTCELNERLHRKVIDLCVNLMLEDLESSRYETNTQQLAQKL
jgi:hypothetical protein